MTLLANEKIFDLDKLLGGFYHTNNSSIRRSPIQKTFNATTNNRNTTLTPKVDIIKQNDGYELITELPGINKDQLTVTVENSILTIKTLSDKSNDTTNEKNEPPQYLRKERHTGEFQRSFDLGQDIELSDITANFKDGLLTLNIPKQKEDTATSRNIEIH